MKLRLFLFCVLVIIFTDKLIAQNAHDSSLTVGRKKALMLLENGRIEAQKGKILLKLDRDFAQDLSADPKNTLLQKGARSVDMLNKTYKSGTWKRLFPYAGKYEKKHRKYDLDLWYIIEVKDSEHSLADIIRSYDADRHIQYAEPLYITSIHQDSITKPLPPGPNDPLYGSQWHYNNTGQTGGRPGADISLPEAWKSGQSDPSVVVAVIDEGIDTNHEDLRSNIWINHKEIPGNGIDDDNNGYVDDVNGYNFIDNTGIIPPGMHGTHVAGIISASNNNLKGICGIAGGNDSLNIEGVKLMSCTVFREGSNGNFPAAFVYAADNGAIIAQNSWSTMFPDIYNIAVLEAIDYFIAEAGFDENGKQTGPLAGGLVIFSAGNYNSPEHYYPGCYERVISVAATTHLDTKADYSNFGDWVDISAPGGESDFGILSTLPANSYGYLDGTSMACPHVSGVAALIVSKYGRKGLSPEIIGNILTQSSDDIYRLNPAFTNMLGSGRLNANKALEIADNPNTPEAITDLRIEKVHASSLSLSWTAPCILPEMDKAWSYDIRYSKKPINETNFKFASQAKAHPIAADCGSPEHHTIENLTPGSIYYFAVKSKNIYDTTSAISNVVRGRIPAAPVCAISDDTLYIKTQNNTTFTTSITIANRGKKDLTYNIREFEKAEKSLLKTEISQLYTTTSNNPEIDPYEHQNPDDTKNTPIVLPDYRGNDGEDGYGYAWVNSEYPDGPDFNWAEISGTGTELFIPELSSAKVVLPFEFPFYGSKKSVIFIGNPGIISFDEEKAWSWYVKPIPSADTPNGIILPFWDDIASSASSGHGEGKIYYKAEKDRVIIQYQKISHWYDSGSEFTFQVILYKDGRILFQYLKMSGPTSMASIGIENSDGTDGLTISERGKSYARDSMAILIQAPWLIKSASPATATIAPETSMDISLTIEVPDIIPDSYKNTLHIRTNDPLRQWFEIPFYVQIKDTPRIVSDHTNISFDPVSVGSTDSTSIKIKNICSEQIYLNLEIDSGYFITMPTHISLMPNEIMDIIVCFKPEFAGLHTSTLRILNAENNGLISGIPLEGAGIVNPEIAINKELFDVRLSENSTTIASLKILNAHPSSRLTWNITISDPSPVDTATTINQPSRFKYPLEISYLAKQPYTENLVACPEDNSIFGLPGHYENTVYRYDINANSWDTLFIIPEGNMWHADGVIFGNDLFIMRGGYSQPHIWTYNIFDGTIAIQEDILFNESYKNVCTDGRYVFIGYSNWALGSGEFIKYDPGAKSWTFLPVPVIDGNPNPGFSGMDYYRDRIYCVFSNSGESYLYKYNIPSDTWEMFYDFPDEASYVTDGFIDPVTNNYIAYSSNGIHLINLDSPEAIVLEHPDENRYIDYLTYIKEKDISGIYLNSRESFVRIATYPEYHWIDTDPRSGETDGSGSTDISVLFNSEGLNPGTYKANLEISSNDVNHSEIVIPVTLEVSGNSAARRTKEMINNVPVEKIRFYPNPANDQITISNPERKSLTLRLLDLSGKTMISGEHSDQASIFLDVRTIRQGIYFLEIRDQDDQVNIEKVVIK